MDVQMTWNLEDLFPSEEMWNVKLEEAKRLFEQLTAQKGHAAATAADLLRTARLYEESCKQKSIAKIKKVPQNLRD